MEPAPQIRKYKSGNGYYLKPESYQKKVAYIKQYQEKNREIINDK